MEIKIVEGMKVRVREDLSVEEIYRTVGVVSEMVEVAGKTFTVEEVDNRDNSFRLVEVGWWWTPEMVEVVKEVEMEGEENMLEVGMKVRVRKDLVGGTRVDGLYVSQDMADMGGDVLTIEKYDGLYESYNVEENDWNWKKEMFEEVDVFVKEVGQLYRVLDMSGGHHFDVGEIIILQEVHEDKCSHYSNIEDTERWYMTDVDNYGTNVELFTGSVDVDNVERPPHYTKYSTEVIDIIEEVIASYPEDMRYHIGNVIKYLLRAPHKGKLEEDLSKALWYIDRILD